jgi:hypothetical protein
LLDTFANGNNGRLYHAIMYGKNVMGNYADKLSYEERWQVIHYIRSCQADGAKLQYDEEKNLFRPQAATAGAMAISMAINKKMVPLAPIKMKAVKMTTPATVPDPAVGGGDGGHMKRR